MYTSIYRDIFVYIYIYIYMYIYYCVVLYQNCTTRAPPGTALGTL